MNIQLSQIPGLDEAVAAALDTEEQLRLAAFMGEDDEIAGIPVRLFTPRHFATLALIKNPLITGGELHAEAVGQFLWVVSLRYTQGAHAAPFRDAFLAEIAGVDFLEAVSEITRYLEESFFDKLPNVGGASGANKTLPTLSSICWMIDKLASAYGWSDEEILDKPFLRLNQYLRAIVTRERPEIRLTNGLSSRARARRIAEYTQERIAAANAAVRASAESSPGVPPAVPIPPESIESIPLTPSTLYPATPENPS